MQTKATIPKPSLHQYPKKKPLPKKLLERLFLVYILSMNFQVMRVLRTVRHIPARMWWARAASRMRRLYYRTPLYPILQERDIFPAGQNLTPQVLTLGSKTHAASILESRTFTFNGETHELTENTGWLPQNATHLWQFHLHYWDWLGDLKAAPKASKAQPVAQALVRDWLLQCDQYHPVMWHPYPTSLRIVNMLVYANWVLENAKDDLQEAYWQSLNRQVSYLVHNLEWELEGNHLIKNIKALIYAGLCLTGRQSLFLEGQKLLLSQLSAQILPDGTHYERSPMYHAQVLQDVLEIQMLIRQAGGKAAPQLVEMIDRMGTALQTLRAGDGGLFQMHDGAEGHVKHIQNLLKQTDAGDTPQELPNGGYARLSHGSAHKNMLVLCDVGGLTPAENPGHAHAQTLCFELAVGAERIFVNRGTYAYQTPKRTELRSTASHNTVAINGGNSAEVWGQFRVGRRPTKVTYARTPTADGGHKIVASHNGYRHAKLVHHRALEMSGDGSIFMGEDTLTPTNKRATFAPKNGSTRVRGYFHVHPSVTCKLLNETQARLTAPSGLKLDFTIKNARLFTQPSTYAAQFGEEVDTTCLVLQPNFRTGTQFSWKLEVVK